MTEISVVLPTYNRVERLKQVLRGLELQSCPLEAFEVIVVSDGSTDDTRDYLNKLNSPLNVRTIFQANQGPAAARNTGIQHAAGRILVFIDDDVVPSPNLLAEHLKTHAAAGDHVAVLGPMLTPPDFQLASWVKWEQVMLEKYYRAMQNGDWEPTARQFYTGNASLARQHLLLHGGFDTLFTRAEDVELGYRLAAAGMRFVFNPQAIGYHYAERSFAAWRTIAFAYGVNDVIFATQRGQGWLLPAIGREFQTRHVMVRALTLLCLDRPVTAKFILGLLRPLNHSHESRLSLAACSLTFNSLYYQGVASELGGREAFLAILPGTRPAALSHQDVKRGFLNSRRPANPSENNT